MSGIYKTPIFRKNLNFSSLSKIFNNNSKDPTKCKVLNEFLKSAQSSKNSPEEYIHYLCTMNFGWNFVRETSKIPQEHKEYLTYLCSNERSFLGVRKITRGQMKVWFLLYQLQNNKKFPDFDTLVNWIKTKIESHCNTPELTCDFIKEIKENCKKYIDSIHANNTGFTILGKGAYKKSLYFLETVTPKAPETPRITPGGPKTTPKRLDLTKEAVNTPRESLKDSPRILKPSPRIISQLVTTSSKPIIPVHEANFEYIPVKPTTFSSKLLKTVAEIKAPPLPKRLTKEQKNLSMKSVPLMIRNSFLYEERKFVDKKKSFKHFYLKDNSIQIIRNALSYKIKSLLENAEFPYERLLIIDHITNFAIDTITILKETMIHVNPKIFQTFFKDRYPEIREMIKIIPASQIILNNQMISVFLDYYLPYTCNEKVLEVTKKFLKTCFNSGFLSMSLGFDFEVLKFDLFQKRRTIISCTKEDNEAIDNLLISYADYCKVPGAFSGYVELHILKNLPQFRDYSEEIIPIVQGGYDTKTSHVGGNSIKSDGNCVIIKFIYEYIKHEKDRRSIGLQKFCSLFV